MSFANFTNPYQNPTDIPEHYRKHPKLSKLFKADGSYVRPAEDPVTIWAFVLLHQEYGVPLDALELELYADSSEGVHQGRRYQGPELLIACPKSNVIPVFLLWILRSELVQRQIAGKVTGTTGRGRLPNPVSASLKIPQVSLELQKSIADEAMRRRDRAKQLRNKLKPLLPLQKCESSG